MRIIFLVTLVVNVKISLTCFLNWIGLSCESVCSKFGIEVLFLQCQSSKNQTFCSDTDFFNYHHPFWYTALLLTYAAFRQMNSVIEEKDRVWVWVFVQVSFCIFGHAVVSFWFFTLGLVFSLRALSHSSCLAMSVSKLPKALEEVEEASATNDLGLETPAQRSLKRSRLQAVLESQFQKLGLPRVCYEHLLPQDGPDVSKRVWEKQARRAREALRCSDVLSQQVLLELTDRLEFWQGRGFTFPAGHVSVK